MTRSDLILLDDLLMDFKKLEGIHISAVAAANKVLLEINRIWTDPTITIHEDEDDEDEKEPSES